MNAGSGFPSANVALDFTLGPAACTNPLRANSEEVVNGDGQIIICEYHARTMYAVVHAYSLLGCMHAPKRCPPAAQMHLMTVCHNHPA